MRRGDVRSALLIALLDGPAHGYELIQRLEARTDGRWRPSPGSVYPVLQQLADEGLVTATDNDGRRTSTLTDAGRTEAEQRLAGGGAPWDNLDRDGGGGEHGALRVALRDLHVAAKQVAQTGTPEVVAQTTEVLTEARRSLYRLLAES